MERYEIRFRNGIWTIFDHERYEAVAAFGLRRDAEIALSRG